jgi:hypothetical protein
VVLNHIHFWYAKATSSHASALVEWAKDCELSKPKWLKPGVP